MGQTTILIMILTVVSKIFGFVRESVMAAYIGAGDLKSIYTTAMTIPNVLMRVVSAGILSGYIPIYNKVKNEKGEEHTNEFTSNLINLFMIYGFVAFIIVFIFARQISRLFSPDLKGVQLDIATNFTRIMIFAIFPFLYSSVIKGYLNIKGNFVDPVVTGFILNILTIIATILTSKFKNPYILIIGALIANVFQYIRYPFVSKKLGFKYSKTLDLNSPYIKRLMVLVIPIMISSAADQFSLLIDNSMASGFFGVSSVSKIFYAKTMLNFIMGVVTMSVTAVTFPEIAKLGQAGNLNEMRSKTGSAIVFSMILVIPATLGMMVLSTPIIKIAFERNAFTKLDTEIVSSLLVSYAPYIIFASLIKILANGFYSVGDSKTPLVIILIQQGINILLNLILSRMFGLDGLAYATSISTFLASILMMYSFNRKIGNIENKDYKKSLIKITISSIIISVIARIIMNFAKFSLFVNLLISIFIAGFSYLIILKLLNIDEVEIVFKSINKKICKIKFKLGS